MRPLPVLAERLLQAFDVPRRNDALMGDLIEEYGEGRPAVWLWRQTLGAIAATAWRDIQASNQLVFWAVVSGIASKVLYAELAHACVAPWPRTGGAHVVRDVVAIVGISLWRASAGWLVGQVGGTRRGAMVVAYLAVLAAWDVASLAMALGTGCVFLHAPGTILATLAATWFVTLAAGLLLPSLRRPVKA
jgi:hypothetical protein